MTDRMSTYRVVASRVERFAFLVEADSEDDARERFIADGTEVEQWYEVLSDLPVKNEELPSLYVESVTMEAR